MDVPNVAPAGPAAPDSQIYITLQVRHSRGNQAAEFYQDVFGAIPIQRVVQEVGLRRPTYGRLNRIIYLRYNAHIIFKVVEVDMPANLTSQQLGFRVSVELEVLYKSESRVPLDPRELHWERPLQLKPNSKRLLTSQTLVVPTIYVDDPAAIVQWAQQYANVQVTTEVDGNVHLTLLRDPYSHVWTIGSSALAPGLY